MQQGRIAAERQQHFRRITFLVARRTYAIDSDAICADLVTKIVCAQGRLPGLLSSGAFLRLCAMQQQGTANPTMC